MPQNKFDKLVELYRAIEFNPNSRRGSFTSSTKEQIENIKMLLSEESDEYGLKVTNGNIDTLTIGQTIELEVGDPKIALGIVATDIDDFLTAPKVRIKEPSRYFIIKDKFCVSDEVIPDAIERYRYTLKFIDLLKQAAAYLDENSGELIFIAEGKYEVPTIFKGGDLNKIDVSAMTRLINSFENDTHKDQKLAILAKSVQSICGVSKTSERFQVLLENVPQLLKSFSEGYRLFVADFSYEKIVDQLEVAKLEEIGKIHKTFSDIQNQILGIPVATILVATQMKSATNIGYQFWVNTAVMVGCLVFFILSTLVLKNQLHSLTAIGNEISRKKQQMLDEYKSVEDLITKSFPLLEARLKTQRNAFWVVDFILVIGLILSIVIYFSLTEPAWSWMITLTDCLTESFKSQIT